MESLGLFGAALAVGLAGVAAGIGESMIVASGLNAILRNPETKGKIMTLMVLFIALDESVAIYGLIVAFKILSTDPAAMTSPYPYLAAGLSIGLVGLAVGIGEGYIAKTSLDNIGKNPELSSTFMILTILGLALVESAAIYGLIISFRLLG